MTFVTSCGTEKVNLFIICVAAKLFVKQFLIVATYNLFDRCFIEYRQLEFDLNLSLISSLYLQGGIVKSSGTTLVHYTTGGVAQILTTSGTPAHVVTAKPGRFFSFENFIFVIGIVRV